jgi:ribonuclease BN (tRNA processing enzyme)
MTVTFLGICANQTATHEGVSFILDCGTTSILVDAGPGVVRQIQRAGRHCTDIAHVLVTHTHGDHTLGFPYFVWNHFYEGLEGRTGPKVIHLYAFSNVLNGLRQMLEFCYDTSKYPFVVEYHSIAQEAAAEISIGDVVVKTIPVDHTTPNFGLRFDWHGKSLGYSSDTIYHEGFTRLAAGVDLLVHEGFTTKDQIVLSRKVKHATAQDAGRCARETGAKALALVHLFPACLSKIEVLLEEARQECSCEVFVPSELSSREL